MTLLTVIGDCTTTTCLALAAGWPRGDDVVVFEADPSGGSLAGWLDAPASPSLATIVANTTAGHTPPGDTITAMVQQSASGTRFIAAPCRSVPAFRAIDEAATTVIPWLAAQDTVVLADAGRHRASDRLPFVADVASTVLLVHRQDASSAAAAAVRVERLIEVVEQVAGSGIPIVLAILGADPFDPTDVAQFVEDSTLGAVSAVVQIAEDPLSAAVLAGRTGVSEKRLRRLPLMRTAATVAGVVRPFVMTSTEAFDGGIAR